MGTQPAVVAPSASTTHEAMATLPAIVWEADPATFRTTYVSPQALTQLGYRPDEWLAQPDFWRSRIHPDDRERLLAESAGAVLSPADSSMEYRFLIASGEYRWFRDLVRVVDDDAGRRLVGVMVDVTDARTRAGAEAAAAAAAATALHEAASHPTQLNDVLDNLADGVYYVDQGRRITYWNRGAERLTGYRAPEVLGRHCFDNLLAHVDGDGKGLCHAGCPLSASIADGVPREAEVWLCHADGSRRAVHVRTAPVQDAAGAIVGAVEVFSDATGLFEARDAAEAARREAFTDPLTRLPNRRLLDAVLASRKDDLDRQGLPFGLLMLDVDHFKRFNDAYGHAVGDQALVVVAATLRAAVRGGDSLTRWGGEEFAIVAAQVDAAALATFGERILALVRAARVPSTAGSLPVRLSIGAALALPDEDLPDLFARADHALLQAKQEGRDRLVLAGPAPRGAEAREPGAGRR